MFIDARVRVTRMMIRQSFMELLKTTRLSKMTVTELCEKAGIHRVTFYKHYLDVFDLYERTVEELIRESVDRLAKKYKNSPKEAIEAAFCDIYENPDILILFSENVENIYRLKSFQMYINILSGLNVFVPSDSLKSDSDFIKTFISCGCGGILSVWISDGMKEDPVETADKLYLLIESALKSYGINFSA